MDKPHAHALWDQIRHGPVLAVTFNYDTLFEGALADAGLVFGNINDYTSAPHLCRVIKPHGSINWENLAGFEFVPNVGDRTTTPSYLIGNARRIVATQEYRVVEKAGGPNRPDRAWLPAVAIPTVSKSQFVCPERHLQAFRESARNVTKILIIGWRAADQHFLKELATAIQRPVRVWAVCENEVAAKEPLERLKAAGIQGGFEAHPLGFTGFVRSRKVEALLSDAATTGR